MNMEPCPLCGMTHEPELPHDPTTMTYQFQFWKEHGRTPTWEDAWEHCPFTIQETFAGWLKQVYGIERDEPVAMTWPKPKEPPS